MVRLILFLFAFASMFPLHSQLSKTEDSLRLLLKKNTKTDTTKLMLLIKLSTELQFSKPLEGIRLADEAIELSSSFQNPRAKILAYLSKGYCYHSLSKIDSAENSFQEALLTSQKIQDKKLIVDSYNGICWNFKQNDTVREYIAKKSIELAKSIGYEFGQMQPSTTLFFINCGKDLKIATSYALNTLKLAEKYNSHLGLFWGYTELSIINQYQNSFDKAENYAFKALKEIQKLKDFKNLANAYNNLGEVYNYWQKPDKAFYYYNLGLIISEKYNLTSMLGMAYSNRGEICKKLNRMDDALRDLKKSLFYHQKFLISVVDLAIVYFNIGEISFLKKDFNSAIFNLEKALDLCRNNYNLNAPVYKIRILEVLAKCYDGVKNYKKAEMTLWELYKATEYKFNTDKYKISNELTEKYQADKKDKEYQILKQKNHIQDLELNKRNTLAYILAAGILLLFIVGSIVLYERRKTEKLLLNILPKVIANRLRRKKTIIADHIDEASVVFIDIVNFTQLSSGELPKSVVNILNAIFTEFDHLTEKYGLEKIKTIGDCYMAGAGIPLFREDHAVVAAKFALEAMKIIDNGQLTMDNANENTEQFSILNKSIQFRCGIACGPIVAGVIGEKKFIYDIWGDTVNTASRMEEYGEPGRIQVTQRFKDKLSDPLSLSKFGEEMTLKSPNANINKERAVGWFFEERGVLEIKGKGKMKTWFLN